MRAGIAALVLLLLAAGRPAGAVSYPNLFGTREVHAESLKMFPKWRGVVDRYRGEERSCPSGECDKPTWAQFVEQLRGMDRAGQLNLVNQQMNRKTYIIDPINWNLPDYWATPFQFLRKNGDCEDYAIAKYMALKAAGVPVADMRIVVLHDLNLRLAHAVLAVYVQGQAMILDNQIPTVVPSTSIRHYQPVYSVNEEGWWRHFP